MLDPYNDGEPTLVGHGHVVGGPAAFLAAVADQSTEVHRALMYATLIVCEGFTKLKAVASPDPLVTLGQLQMYALLKGKEMKVSMPSQRTVVDHDDLRRIGWWPGGKGHADTAQAIRHVIALLLAEGSLGMAKMITPIPEDQLAERAEKASDPAFQNMKQEDGHQPFQKPPLW